MESQSAQPAQEPSIDLITNPTQIPLPKKGMPFTIPKLKPLTWAIVGLASFLALLFIILLLTALSNPTTSTTTNNTQKVATNSVQIEHERQVAASEAAAAKQVPINQLQQAYSDSVGSDSSKRILTIDADGVAVIEYEIASKDGQIILKTSYENFADLSARVFNIPTIKRLNVTTYANKFTDTFGKPNVFTLKMQLTKETNSKINWSVKKYAYVDYATILDLHELNPDLSKDYLNLTKKTR